MPNRALQRVFLVVLTVLGVDALFVQPPFTVQPFPALKLTEADRLGIPYQGIAYDAGKAASLASFALSLNAQFGPLKESDFRALQKFYCGWSETKSRVVWAKGRTYTLLDFLPPLLQATSGLHFRSSRTTQRGLPSFVGDRVRKYTQQQVLLTSNCWGFAWELLFQADNADTSAMTISTADPTSAWRAFTGLGFDLIQSSRTKPQLLTDSKLRNARIQGGDVLLIWHQNPSTVAGTDLYLDHVATVIDQDLYFEKSGSGDKVPFRLNTWNGLVANFPPSIFFWEWRRLARNNPLSSSVYGGRSSEQMRLQPATELFGVDAQVAAARTDSKNPFLQDRFSILSQLRPNVAKSISLQADTGDGDVVEGQTYTGILVLEDLEFFPETGRAYLPKSAFEPQWYTKMLEMMPRNPYN